MSFTVIEYSMSELRGQAEDFLAKHSLLRLPINIERIIGRKILGLSLVPMPGLHQTTGWIGFLSGDCATVSVDERIMTRFPYQYRFTLAHEAAHYILHRSIVEECHAQNPTQWKTYLLNESNAEWAIMERQADEFARTLLAPSALLREAVQPLVEKARSNGLELRDLGRDAKKRLSIMLESKFEATAQDLYMRLEDEDLP